MRSSSDGRFMTEPISALPDGARRVLPDGSVLLRGPYLRVRIAVLKPGVVLCTARGEVGNAADDRIETALLDELDAELARAGSLTLFADLRESPRMPSSSRQKIASWTRRHQARLLPSHVLTHPGLLEKALSMIMMLVGSGVFRIHTAPKPFLELLRRAAPRISELPSAPEE